MWRNHNILDPQTNMRVTYGNEIKVRRNRDKITGLFRLNTNPIRYQPGEKLVETASDPLHRDPKYIMLQQRIESSASGRSRGYFRPAAPAQVAWKYAYWQNQPGHRSPGIGPYNVQEKKSILFRISGALSGITGGKNG